METPIARLLIERDLPEDTAIIVDVENDEVMLKTREAALEGEVSG